MILFFCRFLRLLSEYDWSFSPLIVDINGDLTPDDGKEINVTAAIIIYYHMFSFLENFLLTHLIFVQESFISNRKQYEGNMHNAKPAMFLATSYDKESEAWTMQSPTVAVSSSTNSILFAIRIFYTVDFYLCIWYWQYDG